MNKKDLITYGTICSVITSQHFDEFYTKFGQGAMYCHDKIAEVSLEIFKNQKEVESSKPDFDWMEWLETSTCHSSWDEYVATNGYHKLKKFVK